MSKKILTNKIIHGDAIKVMRQLPENSVDLIFADPPYNLQLTNELHRPDSSLVRGVNEDWDKFSSFEEYDKFTQQWLTEAKRVLKKNGTIWVIGSYHNIYRMGTILQNLDYWILNDIVWRKNNPMPNFKGTRFTNAHETLIWAKHKNKEKYTFNYDSMKSLNEDLQMRSDWLIPICTGHERLKNQAGKKVHPTQKPEALLYRIILSSSNVGDTILDPFFGTGTSGYIAKILDRKYIGIEMDKEYIAYAETRISRAIPIEPSLLKIKESKKALQRIPFGWLVERGLLEPGTILYDYTKKYKAKVRADGNLVTDKSTGSIHQIGSELQGGPVNGWTFWHLDVEGKLKPIDILRDKLRKNLN